MKYFFCFIFCFYITDVYTQINLLKEVNRKADALIKRDKDLTEAQVSEGLIEALIQGSHKSVRIASAKDGFNKNSLIRIPFPEEAQKMKKTLIKTGFSEQVIQFENSINRAAELASKEALNIFIDAIKSITINDAFGILKGEDDGATRHLERSTYKLLYDKFSPIIENAIKTVDVTRYWNELTNIYNSLPLTKPVNSDLEEYVTNKAIYGLFILIEEEEKNIRNNPKSRASDLLKKVFK